MKGVARVGDTVTGTCRASASGHPRTFTGTWQTGSGFCTVNGIQIVRVGDTGTTDCGHHFVATTGSSISSADGLAIHRVDDEVTVVEGGEGTTVTGSNILTSN
ncbi:hypothetical protein D3C87_460250 [compost metagenome]